MMNYNILFIFLFVPFHFTFSQNWEGFGEGINYGIYNLYTDTTDNLLYLGGSFKFADGLEVNGVTAWDGQQFYSLNGGMGQCNNFNCGPARPLTRYKDRIYFFIPHPSVGGVNVKSIASWDGEGWDIVGGGLTSQYGYATFVRTALVYEDELYVGGTFHIAGQDTIRGVAKWDGENWHSLNFPSYIAGDYVSANSIIVFNNEIYVGGNFYFEFEGQYIHDIIKYDGTNWQKVANGSFNGIENSIGSIIVYKNDLYIGGLIRPTPSNPGGGGILKLEGDQWVNVGGGINANYPTVHDMFIFDDKLYVVGSFHYVGGGIYANGIAAWDGEQWCSLGSEFNDRILTGESFNGEIYIGGGFTTIDGEFIDHFARWNGEVYFDTCGAIVSAIKPEIAKKTLDVFPNPASHEVRISLSGGYENQTYTLSIFNILGERLFEQRGFDPGEPVDVSGLSSGTYILQLQSGEGVMARKFVVQR